MIPSTVDRVPLNTVPLINNRIHESTVERVAHYAASDPAIIDRRLRELDEEWDIERTLEANAASVAVVGLSLGATLNRRWLFVPAAVAAFLFQHAIQGWCPPLPLFRRLGFRTASEIDTERYALKFIRGDFRHLSESFDDASEMARQTLDAMQR